MNLKLVVVLVVAALAGCLDDSSSPGSNSVGPVPVVDALNETRIWNTVVNVTTRGATEVAGYYSHTVVPSRPGLIEETDPNCVRLVVRGARLANLAVTATWNASGPEETLLLYHYLKESDGPFRGAESGSGKSPLLHASDFEGRITSTEWLTIGVHPSTGLPVWRGSVDTVQIHVTLTGTWTEQNVPAVEEFHKCAPKDKALV